MQYPKRDKRQYSNGMRFDIVIVLGVHRSGTSAITKGLELFGVDLGQNLLPANEYNPKGYFEDNQLVDLNDNILRKSGSLWSALQFLEPADLLGARFEKEQNEAREFLKGKLAQGIPIGLKDPRLCRTLPFWQKIFEEQGLRVGYLLAYRSPDEVAASLKKRDDFSIEYGENLWASYQMDVLRHLNSKKWLVIKYDNLLKKPRRELRRVAEFLGAEWHPEDSKSLEYQKRFLDSSMRHHRKQTRTKERFRFIRPLILGMELLARTSNSVCRWSVRAAAELVFNQMRNDPVFSILEKRITWSSRPSRPGFWRRLERSIRKRRKKWINRIGFDQVWYLKEYPDVKEAGMDPLYHYLEFGIREGRRKSEWSKKLSILKSVPKELERSIRKRRKKWINRICFDRDWYLNRYPDVAEVGIDAFWHYQNEGIKEGRFRNRKEEKKARLVEAGSKQEIDFITDSESRSKSKYKVFIPSNSLQYFGTVQTDIRAIALYLPQFHAIPENDKWWGKGFTEWINVKRGTPHYEGHYQPHVPHQDLGYYDLNDPTVMEKQVAMAKAAGIEGFCFYYYWFNGKRLLNMPTDRMLATGKPDFPFCFCWANENWTRTWDGGDNEILIEQEHTAESDKRLIYDLLPAFRDSRYIRVAGKPLLVVYRPGLLPNARRTTNRWREICRKEGIGEIHLAFMLGFEDLEPASIGFDTAIQMPPLRSPLPNLKKEIKTKNSEKFVGEIRDYRGLRKGFDLNQMDASTWPAVCPSWDNTARKMERAHSWIRSSPENYLTWLKEVVDFLRKNRPAGERIVFINSWNEWGEGCHLEPDEKYGYAWLNATRCALTDTKPPVIPARLRVLVVGHDAARNGAQILLLTMLREWKKRDDVDFRLILLCDGVLRSDFQKTSRMIVLTDYPTEEVRKEALEEFCAFGPNVILANTVVSGSILPTLKRFGVPIVSYVHELQKSIERWAPGPTIAATVSNADHFIAVSKPVEENLVRNHGVPSTIISCQNPYIKTSHPLHLERLENFRSELGVQRNEKIVFGCGTPDWRKGADIFVQVAENVIQQFRKVHFIWIGPERSEAGLKAFPKNPRIRFTGEREFPRDILPLGDVFFLPSREDPFPLVALEAADAGLPIVCFADAGGIPEFVGNNCGRCVPLEDAIEAGNAILEILRNDELRESLGKEARNSVRIKHDAVQGSGQILSILKQVYCEKAKNPRDRLKKWSNPLVSVVVPNYNHAQFLPERIASITNQTYSNIEIIFLDDNSTDESTDIIKKFTEQDARARYLGNDVNSGSSFKQWRKGLREAKGKYVWIAESDDSADPELLQSLVARLEDNEKAVLAACCPRMTSLEGSDLGIPTDWFADIGGKQWENDFSSAGQQVVAEILSKKNAILNASGVVFRNSPELAELVDEDMKLCGDWLFWVRLLVKGDFEYVARPLNYWRIGSSNARTRTPGEVEWSEGSKILEQIAEILQLEDSGKQALLNTFRQRCKEWQEKHKETNLSNNKLSSKHEIFLRREGWCPICDKEESFIARHHWLRDHYLCSGCGSIPRERAIMHVIQTLYPKWRSLHIHESSPLNRGASVKMREQCKKYIATQYDLEVKFGKSHPTNGYRSEDLEKQTFTDNLFDLVVTQDVMEHVFNPENVFREIHRTLKKGGAHIFTTPIIRKEKASLCRAEMLADRSIRNIYPPEYHGNPLSNEGSLVTWHWGNDIKQIATNATGSKIEIIACHDLKMGIEGEYLDVIVQKKI